MRHEITGCFYNPNIHPCREYQMRLEALADYAARQDLEVIWPEGYDMETFLRSVAFREADRCYACYDLRLSYTARMAKSRAFDGFTTTLLYSKYQKHDLIRSIGESSGEGIWGFFLLSGFPGRLVGRGQDFKGNRNVPAVLLRLRLQ